MLIKIIESNLDYLAARGMPRDIIRTRPFELDQHVVTIDSKVDGIKELRIPKKLQLEHLAKFLERPFKYPAIVSISSFPNDGKRRDVN